MAGCIVAVEALPQPTVKFGSSLALTIGNCASAKGYARLMQYVGIPLFKRMVILGDMLTGQELQNLGFELSVVAQHGPHGTADGQGHEGAHNPLTCGSVADMDDLITEIKGSSDFRNGVRNFLDKKPQKWTGT